MSRGYTLGGFVGLVLLIAAGYGASLWNGFTYDDFSVVVGNRFILDWNNLREFLHPSYLERSGELSYRPLVTLSYMADAALWGVRASGFHLSNLFLHALAVCVGWRLVRSWLPRLAALSSAALFAVHPAASEAVLSIAYREELLFTLFGLGALALVAPALREQAPLRLRGCMASWGLFILALLSKEMAVSLPLLVAFLAIHSAPGSPAHGAFQSLWRQRRLLLGLFVITVVYLLVRFLLLRGAEEAAIPPLSPTWWNGLLTMLSVLANDVRLFVLPLGLSADHDLQLVTRVVSARLALSALILSGLCWLAWRYRRRAPLITTGVVWFLVALIPVLNIVPIANPSAERYLYFPFLGLSLAVGGAVARWEEGNDGGDRRRAMSAWPAVLVALCFVVILHQRSGVWRDNFSLWQATLAQSSSKARPYHNLADAWSDRARAFEDAARRWQGEGRDDQARTSARQARHARLTAQRLYGEALRRNPSASETLNNLGNLFRSTDRIDRAMVGYLSAVTFKARYADAWNNLGIGYKRRGYVERAALTYLRTLMIAPRYAPAYKNLGIILWERGQKHAARKVFARSLELNPRIEEHATLRQLIDHR